MYSLLSQLWSRGSAWSNLRWENRNCAFWHTPTALATKGFIPCDKITVGNVTAGKDLGVWFDSALTMTIHVNKTSSLLSLPLISDITRNSSAVDIPKLSYTSSPPVDLIAVIVFYMVNLVKLSASFSEFKMHAPVSSTAPPSLPHYPSSH